MSPEPELTHSRRLVGGTFVETTLKISTRDLSSSWLCSTRCWNWAHHEKRYLLSFVWWRQWLSKRSRRPAAGICIRAIQSSHLFLLGGGLAVLSNQPASFLALELPKAHWWQTEDLGLTNKAQTSLQPSTFSHHWGARRV